MHSRLQHGRNESALVGVIHSETDSSLAGAVAVFWNLHLNVARAAVWLANLPNASKKVHLNVYMRSVRHTCASILSYVHNFDFMPCTQHCSMSGCGINVAFSNKFSAISVCCSCREFMTLVVLDGPIRDQ